MSMTDEEEPFDLTLRSGGGGLSGVSSIDSIIQTLNKRYEVYQRKRSSMTPFGSPSDPPTLAQPIPHSILGDSAMTGGPSTNSGAGATAALHPLKSREFLSVPITGLRTRPAPYWEERELYITAEDLCCFLNGGVNYRLMCERYRRTLEVLLTLVREDVQLFKSVELELVTGCTINLFLAKLKELLKESKRMLEEASVSVPTRLAAIIEQLPSGDVVDALGSSASVLATSAATGNAVSHDVNGPHEHTRAHRAAPLCLGSPSVGEANGASAAADKRQSLQAPQKDPQPAFLQNGYSERSDAASRDGNRLSQHPVTTLTSEHLSSSGALSNKSSLASAAENLQKTSGGASRCGSDFHLVVSSGEAAASTATCKSAPIPLMQGDSQSQELAQSAVAHAKQGISNQSTSPTPATPTSAIDVPDTHGREYKTASDSGVGGSPNDKRSDEMLEKNSLAARTSGRGRLRRLEELYGEDYAKDGIRFLTDALNVVFTREYDQDTAATCQIAFSALQRDVTEKFMPALASYASFQRCTTESAPLRSVYLTSCLEHRVRPNNIILDHLKHMDEPRSVEVMSLGALHLGDRGMAAFVESVVPRAYRLRQLDLSDNDLTDGALALLHHSLRYHPSLMHLNLSRNPLTDGATTFLLRIARTLPRLSGLLLHNCSMNPAAQQMVETEVRMPGTYTTPIALHQCSVQTPCRASCPTFSATRTAASQAPPLGQCSLSSPWTTTTRAESMPSGWNKRISGDRNAVKKTFPRGLGVLLDPIQHSQVQYSSSSTCLLPGNNT